MAEQLNTGTQQGDASLAPEGHDEAMLQALDQNTQQTQQAAEGEAPTTGEEPELILGKFKSQEELAAAYQELQTKLSQGGAQQEQSQEEIQQTAEQAVEAAEGVDMASLSQEYAEAGELSQASYEALEKAGIPRTMVEQYIAGQEATAEATRNDILSDVGGEEEFGRISQWAVNNLSADQIERYNEAVDSGDGTRMREAVQSLAYQYTKANGSEPQLMGGSGGAAAGSSFESVAQLTAAMSDPRYASDPAYRNEVAQKLARSNVM